MPVRWPKLGKSERGYDVRSKGRSFEWVCCRCSAGVVLPYKLLLQALERLRIGESRLARGGGALLGGLLGCCWNNTARIWFVGIELGDGAKGDRIGTSEVADSPFRHCFWVTNGDGAERVYAVGPINERGPVFEVAVVVFRIGRGGRTRV